jgi:membrane-associated protease RseP (regulator of RpoE activity)
MKKLNILFQLSTLTSVLVAGLFTYGWAQNADSKKEQKLKIDIEVTENGKTKKITKELYAIDGEDIQAILEDLDVLEDIDIRGKGERIEIKVKKEVDGAKRKDLNVHVSGDDDFVWFEHVTSDEKRPQLGVFISSYDENGKKGAVVTDIVDGSAAEKSGLKEDDVIIGINKTDISSEKQLREVIGEHEIGDKVTVKYLRDGKELSKAIELGESKADRIVVKDFNFDFNEDDFRKQMEKLGDMDFDFDFSFDDDAPFFGVTPGKESDEKGVELGTVVSGSSAEKMGLQAGDRILKLNGKSVEDFGDLAEYISEQKAGEELSVEYVRDGKTASAKGELGKRTEATHQKRIIRMAPDSNVGGAGSWAPKVVKEVNVVIELADCTKEDEAMLAKPASVEFGKELAINKIEFAPNPSNGQFNLAFELPQNKSTRVMVFDQMGRKVYEELLNNFSGQYKNQIDISAQQNGVYFLIIAQGEKQFTRKIVKQ